MPDQPSPLEFALTRESMEEFTQVLGELVGALIEFKLSQKPIPALSKSVEDELLGFSISNEGENLRNITAQFIREVVPQCSNFSNPAFLGFPDSGNGMAALLGSVAADFLNANLINQTFCAPAASLIEMGMLNWLRTEVGYESRKVSTAVEIAGCFTNGGTISNAIAMIAAREKFRASRRVDSSKRGIIVVPETISHYSIRASNFWIGADADVVVCPSREFRYDLEALDRCLSEHGANVMAIVSYACDSRTGTIDRFREIAHLRDRHSHEAWLHVDACHGFPLLFDEILRKKLYGIELADSITLDPHKVLMVPYTLSAVLFRSINGFRALRTKSDLIMSEPYSLGQTTPLIGSKSWISLKLWFQLKAFGRNGLRDLVRGRHEQATALAEKLASRADFVVLAKPDNNAVVFQYIGQAPAIIEPACSELNRAIHAHLLSAGLSHVHTFPLYVNGESEAPVFPLRIYFGNPSTTEDETAALIDTIAATGEAMRGSLVDARYPTGLSARDA